MAAIAAIFNSHLSLLHSSGLKSSKYQFSLKLQHFEILMCFGRHRILPNFELKLEIPNIMLVCKFEINWSTNKNLRALITYLGRTYGRPAFPYPPLRFAGDKYSVNSAITLYYYHATFRSCMIHTLGQNMFYSVQQGSRYILSLTNQRSCFEVRRLQHHQQIKAYGKTWLERGKSSDVIW